MILVIDLLYIYLLYIYIYIYIYIIQLLSQTYNMFSMVIVTDILCSQCEYCHRHRIRLVWLLSHKYYIFSVVICHTHTIFSVWLLSHTHYIFQFGYCHRHTIWGRCVCHRNCSFTITTQCSFTLYAEKNGLEIINNVYCLDDNVFPYYSVMRK